MRQAERRVRCSERSRDGVSCLSGEFLNDGFGAQAVEEILDSPLLLLTMQRLFDGFPNLGEIADALGLFLVYLGDVETEGSAENIADLILFQREDYVLELLHHLTSGYPAKLAAIAGAIGGAIRQLFEIGAGFELLLNLLDRRERARFRADYSVFHQLPVNRKSHYPRFFFVAAPRLQLYPSAFNSEHAFGAISERGNFVRICRNSVAPSVRLSIRTSA